jgi:hypothetical protein
MKMRKILAVHVHGAGGLGDPFGVAPGVAAGPVTSLDQMRQSVDQLVALQRVAQHFNALTRIFSELTNIPFLTPEDRAALNEIREGFRGVLAVRAQLMSDAEIAGYITGIGETNNAFRLVQAAEARRMSPADLATGLPEIFDHFVQGRYGELIPALAEFVPSNFGAILGRLDADEENLGALQQSIVHLTAGMTGFIDTIQAKAEHFPRYQALLAGIRTVIPPRAYFADRFQATIIAFNALDFTTVQPHGLYDAEAEQANHNISARLAELRTRYTSPYTDPDPDYADDETEYDAMKSWARSAVGHDYFIGQANQLLARDATIVEMEDLLRLYRSGDYYKRIATAFPSTSVYRDLVVAEEMASDAAIDGEEEPADLTAVSRKAHRVIDMVRTLSLARADTVDDLIERLETGIAEKRQDWGLWSRALATRAKTGLKAVQRFAHRSHDQLNPYARQVAALRHAFVASPVSFVAADNVLTRSVDSAAGIGVDYANYLLSQFLMGDASPYDDFTDSLVPRFVSFAAVTASLPFCDTPPSFLPAATSVGYEAYKYWRQEKMTPLTFVAGMTSSLASQGLLMAISSMQRVERPLPALSARPTAEEIQRLQDAATERSQVTQIITGVASPILRRIVFRTAHELLSSLFPGPRRPTFDILDRPPITSITVQRDPAVDSWAREELQKPCPIFVSGDPTREVGPQIPDWELDGYYGRRIWEGKTCTYYRAMWGPESTLPLVLGMNPWQQADQAAALQAEAVGRTVLSRYEHLDLDSLNPLESAALRDTLVQGQFAEAGIHPVPGSRDFYLDTWDGTCKPLFSPAQKTVVFTAAQMAGAMGAVIAKGLFG